MIINTLIDSYVWWFLQLYFLPYRLPEFGNEVDQVISKICLNGICSRR
jgi:hypothetical protein